MIQSGEDVNSPSCPVEGRDSLGRKNILLLLLNYFIMEGINIIKRKGCF